MIHVLIVEDEIPLANELKNYLEKEGFTCDEAHTGIQDKAQKLTEIAQRLKLDFSQLAYVGDDLIDLKAMGLVGFKVAPKNAVKFVKQHVDYVTECNGGDGALREVVELILKSQNYLIFPRK